MAECAFGFIVGNCEDMVCTIDDGRLMGDPMFVIHAKRLSSLCAATNAAVCEFSLTLSVLGCSLPRPVSMKHNIKRIDRLLDNGALHADIALVYQALAIVTRLSRNDRA